MIAFTLTAEYAGSTHVDRGDGPEEVPTFGGGLLFTPDGDFDVAEHLAAGEGVIVLHDEDAALGALLDAYPALKRCPAPDGAAPVSMYERRTFVALRDLAALRDVKGSGSMSRANLVTALEHADAVNRGDVAADATHGPDDAEPSPSAEDDTTAPAAAPPKKKGR